MVTNALLIPAVKLCFFLYAAYHYIDKHVRVDNTVNTQNTLSKSVFNGRHKLRLSVCLHSSISVSQTTPVSTRRHFPPSLESYRL